MAKPVVALNKPNNIKNFLPADDQWELIKFPFKASTAIDDGYLVAPEVSDGTTTGNLTTMGAENAKGVDFIGILAEPIKSTDDDYATAGKMKGVRVPKSPYALAYFKATTGTFTAACVFNTVKIEDAKGLKVEDEGLGARIMGYIDSTHGVCRFSLPETKVSA